MSISKTVGDLIDMFKQNLFRTGLTAFVLPVLLAISSASAQEAAPSTDDIVNFFTSGKGVMKTRGICVGTAQECEQAEKPAALNMFVEFEYNSATLTQESDLNLQRFSRALLDDRLLEFSFAVNGHTDASGAPAYNESLSLLRARTVKDRLVELGVSEERLSTHGLGETNPKFDDPFAPGNRRVEISFGSENTRLTESE